MDLLLHDQFKQLLNVPRDHSGLRHLGSTSLASWRAEILNMRFPNFPLKSSTAGINFITETLVLPPLHVNDIIRILKITNDISGHKTNIKTSASSSFDLWKTLFDHPLSSNKADL